MRPAVSVEMSCGINEKARATCLGDIGVPMTLKARILWSARPATTVCERRRRQVRPAVSVCEQRSLE